MNDHPSIAFVDLDGVLFVEGKDEFIDGASEALRDLACRFAIVIFSCGINEVRIKKIQEMGIPIHGLLPKPFGPRYVVIDDRLDLESCSNSLMEMAK